MLKILNSKRRAVIALTTAAAILLAAFLSWHFIPKAIKTAAKPEGVFVPIIMYHSVCCDDDMLCDYVISPETLEKDIVYLKKNGYCPVFVRELIDFVHCGGELPPKPVIISFDDGFYNNLTQVLPLLEKYDFKATISVVGSYTEKSDEHSDRSERYSYLTSEEISELFNSGLVEIGNHSYDMHSLDKRQGCGIMKGESYEDYRNAFLSDIKKTQDYLSDNCSIAPQVFTYPYGIVSEPSLRLVKSAGFQASLGVEEKPNYITSDPDCLYRMFRYNRPSGVLTEKFMEKALDPLHNM